MTMTHAELVAHYAAVRQRVTAPPPVVAISPAPSVPAPMEYAGRAIARLAWDMADIESLVPGRIIRLASCVSGVPVVEMTSARRHTRIVRARWLAICLLTRFTRLSLPAIGRRLGGRDHTTIMHARDRALDAIGDAGTPDELEACATAIWPMLRDAK